MHKNFTLISLAATASLLASCAVGPDFTRPPVPEVTTYTDKDMPAKTVSAAGTAGAAQMFLSGGGPQAEWWTLFGSKPLNAIVDQALHHNPDLKAANASLRQAQEIYYATRGDLFPAVDASFGPTREKFNPSAYGLEGVPASIFTVYNASVSVSYALDVFGGTRRALEESRANADYQRFERDAAYLTLVSNVVTAAIQEASLSAQIKETQGIIDIEGKQLDVLKTQFEVGASAKSIVLQQQATLAQTQAGMPALKKQLAQTRHQLAVLSGGFPGRYTAESFDLNLLHLPEALPVSLPSALVEHRPDIRAAEEQLHAANADIGIATANMLPQFSLTGNYGSETTQSGKLFGPSAEVWTLAGSITQPIFHGGTLLHERRASIAAHDRAAAQYQSTVLLAFKNVADTLRALEYDAEALRAQVDAADAAKNSLALTQEQFKGGSITYPQLLDAQRTYSQARVSLVQAQAARLSDTAALFQALGGGWPAKAKASVPPAPAAVISGAPASVPGGPPSTSLSQPPAISEKKS